MNLICFFEYTGVNYSFFSCICIFELLLLYFLFIYLFIIYLFIYFICVFCLSRGLLVGMPKEVHKQILIYDD